MLLKRTIVLFWDGSVNNSLYIYLPHHSTFDVFVLHHRPSFSLVNSSHSGRSHSSLDPKTYTPVVYISIRNDIRLPDDSSVKLTSSGLLGDSYLAIQIGSSAKMLVAGGTIKSAPGGAGLSGLIDRITSGGG